MRHMMRWLTFALVLSVAILTRASADSLTYLNGSGSPLQTPGHPIVYSYWTNLDPKKPLRVDAYRIPAERALASLRSETSIWPGDMTAFTRVASIASISRQVAVPAQPPGYYLVVAHADERSYAALVDVTSFGLLSIEADAHRLVVPIDLRTFNRDRYVSLAVIDDRGKRALHANADGLTDVGALSMRKTAYVIGTGADGSVTAQSLGRSFTPYGAEHAAQDIAYIQTDRPIYRPGQTIDLRAIVRTGDIGAYAVPSGARHLTVTGPDGGVIFERRLNLTAFGTLHAIVPLAQDAQLGNYTLQIGTTSRSVTVAAYKKPEYLLALSSAGKTVVGSDRAQFSLDARYVFGRPAAGMHLHYVATLQRNAGWGYGPYEFAVGMRPWFAAETIGEGDFVTDAQGRHRVGIDTKKTDVEEDLTLRVEGRDASGRTVETETNVTVTPASFQVSMQPNEWFARAGHPLSIAVHARSYEEAARPNARVHVSIVGSRWDQKQQKDVTTSTATVDVTTDARGDAAFSWTPHDGGSYQFRATSPDARGFIASANLYLWALGANDDEGFAPIERPQLIAEKSTFAPGEPVRVLVALPKANRDVVIATSADRLVDARLIRVSGLTQTVTIPVPRGVSHLAVSAVLPNESGVENANLTIAIAPPPNALRIRLTPSKARFVPGERARFDVRATDLHGRPVRGEFAIGVVDEALYAVQEDDKTDPFDVFYDRVSYAYGSASWFQPNRTLAKVHATSDVYMAAKIGNESGVPSGAPAALGNIGNVAVRSNFQDTAFWSPSVVTDANGRASLAFNWPDNLTTWRATGVAVTRATQIGRSTSTALVTKDFLVRLEAPRFLRAGDRSSIVGIAHGVRRSPDVRMQLSAGGLATAPFDATLRLGANDDASVVWPVSAPGVGAALLQLRGTDGTRSDGTQTFLPLLGAAAIEHDRRSGSLPEQASLALALPRGTFAGDLHLTLAPSIVAQLVQSVRLFDVYPYYCTEQTTSTALPAAMLLRAEREYGVTLPEDVKPREILAHALDRLTELRHDDGAWGWWESDASDPFMTAYAVYGLAQIRDALGKLPNPYLLESGTAALRAQLNERQPESWNQRALALMALAEAGADEADRAHLAETFDHLRDLDAYGLAVAGLAAHAMHDDVDARRALGALDRSVTVRGDSAFWHRDAWTWEWTSDPIETTAYALRLYTRLEPTSPRIAQIVNFLRAQRRGDWWFTTKDSAAAAVAVAEALRPQPDELRPDETIRITAGTRVIRELHVTKAVLDGADASVVVPASALQHGEKIAFERTGRGALYWSSDWERYLPADATESSDADRGVLDRLFAKPPALSVRRVYHAPRPGAWKIGDEIDVELIVSARETTGYVAIEDPFPAGAEHQPLQGRAADDGWSGMQFLDDRATFFASSLGAYPLHLHYTLRVTTAGSYAAPPPDAYAMYGPPVSALGSPERIEVQP